jgi:hypothetical protein
MSTYEEDRSWSDQWIEKIKAIVGPLLLAPASFDKDVEQAADLIILKARDMRIGARVRRQGYAKDYSNEFTIRSHRDSGTKTEFDKILDGWGDWLFYGHQCYEDIWPWQVINLDSLRSALAKQGWAYIKKNKTPTLRWGGRSNGDGTSFCWFDLSSFPADPPILIAQSGEPPPLSEDSDKLPF